MNSYFFYDYVLSMSCISIDLRNRDKQCYIICYLTSKSYLMMFRTIIITYGINKKGWNLDIHYYRDGRFYRHDIVYWSLVVKKVASYNFETTEPQHFMIILIIICLWKYLFQISACFSFLIVRLKYSYSLYDTIQINISTLK